MNPIRNELELRDELELRRRPIADVVWAFVVARGHVTDTLSELWNDQLTDDEKREAMSDLRGQIRDAESLVRDAGGDLATAVDRGSATDRSATARRWARAEIEGLEAGQREDVATFRRDILRNRLLKPHRVAGWIRKQQRKQPDTSRYTRVPMASDGHAVPYAPGERGWNVENVILEFLEPVAPGSTDFSEWVCRAAVLESGPLGRLKQISVSLARAYDWHEANAVNFILAGLTPPPDAGRYSLRGPTLRHANRITLDVPADATPEEVASLYRLARRGLEKVDRGIDRKTAYLAAFTAEVNDGRSWTAARQAFNERFPEHRFETPQQRKNFARAAQAAFRRVMGRGLVWRGH